ncbi:MAG: hypothetical protein ACPG4J_02120 [Lentibacter algarum]
MNYKNKIKKGLVFKKTAIKLVIIKMEKKMSHPTPVAIKAAIAATILENTLDLMKKVDDGKMSHTEYLENSFPVFAGRIIDEAIDKACKQYDADIAADTAPMMTVQP